MPLYIVHSSPGMISDAHKSEIAADITDVHCEVTGAPREFVHVFFMHPEVSEAPKDSRVSVLASIRSGRTAAQKAQITEGVGGSLNARAGFSLESVSTNITDTPASWVMEGGEIFPEPGEEAEWLAAHSKAKADAVTGAA